MQHGGYNPQPPLPGAVGVHDGPHAPLPHRAVGLRDKLHAPLPHSASVPPHGSNGALNHGAASPVADGTPLVLSPPPLSSAPQTPQSYPPRRAPHLCPTAPRPSWQRCQPLLCPRRPLSSPARGGAGGEEQRVPLLLGGLPRGSGAG